MATIFSPAAEPGPSPPAPAATKKAAAAATTAGEASYMARAAAQLLEEQGREAAAARDQALEEQGRAAWQTVSADGPVTEESFMQVRACHPSCTRRSSSRFIPPTLPRASGERLTDRPARSCSRTQWYKSAMKPTESTKKKPAKKKRAAGGGAAAPDAKRQALLPGAAAPAPAALSKGKRTALLKALTTTLKAAAAARKTKWHEGDSAKLAASTVIDGADFLALFPGIDMSKKGVTTSFSMSADQIATAFGDVKLKVACWSQSYRAFQKAYKTGSKPVSLVSAEGKYSSNTSTLTMKFQVRVSGGGGYGGYSSMYGGGYGLGDDY
jgi:hypothetical protein